MMPPTVIRLHRRLAVSAAFICALAGVYACGGSDGSAAVPTPAASPAGVGVAADGALDAQLEAIRAGRRLPALAAMSFRSGSVIESGAVGLRAVGHSEAVTRNDLWHIGSLTKSMTSTLAALLIRDGRLRWDSTISGALPYARASMRAEYASVRLEELVTHTAGLVTDMTRAPSWSSLYTSTEPMRDQRRRLAIELLSLPPQTARGTYSYSNAGYIVAGAMLEEAAGETWEVMLRRRVFDALGMRSAGFGAPGTPGLVDQPWGHDGGSADFVPVQPGPYADNPAAIGPAGTVHAALADLAAYYAMHLAGARGASTFLSADAFTKLHQPAPGTTYACGWGVTERTWAQGRVLQHSGSNTRWYAVVWLAPNRDLGLFAATNVAGDAGSAATDEAVSRLIARFEAR
jgi:CubicO group peptidase (beta-lactamase class C family)